MTTFDNYHVAANAASIFFEQEFGHSGNVGVKRQHTEADGNIFYELYSKDDPGLHDTFECLVADKRPYAQIIAEGQDYECIG